MKKARFTQLKKAEVMACKATPKPRLIDWCAWWGFDITALIIEARRQGVHLGNYSLVTPDVIRIAFEKL